ncbi:UDP-N-acetylglucosamine 2-epimerase [Thiorhodococcus drewsii AZ1]|uniref:UDP-N-acetylglucosamine 2-epimerase n=1 Tax=Thiorhodococcus drewsii AZ1 TaxID=765913 RepID=G2E6P3_9GAMM|nr:UDP-N-acetylglucosamine 2-epimerase (non-hydrolyzing) [Thiorhodococcus drewsii]EGV28253.1 UDP-N-acetylglucosamine 2-epimerase [Thiorhodococcus drewsii AZ1]
MRIDIIAGARPNFVKIAPIIHAIEARQSAGSDLSYRLVHTGQHYSDSLSSTFFEQLDIPAPHVNLAVGSGTHAEQTGAIMIRYEQLLQQAPTDLCLVVGDVNSTLACAITAQKCGIPVGHVESGLRSADWRMPEEINRLATDAITNWHFTTSAFANANLRRSGVPEERIFFVGNTMIDTLLANQARLRPPNCWRELGLQPGHYFILTMHRPASVDDTGVLAGTLHAILEGTRGLPLVFPVHPRTARRLAHAGALPEGLHPIPPQPYLEFNYLVKHAKAIITDSGGITEEATVLGIPCLNLRETTERPETVSLGTTRLIGRDPARLAQALTNVFSSDWPPGQIPEKWDGKAGLRIAAALDVIARTGLNPIQAARQPPQCAVVDPFFVDT